MPPRTLPWRHWLSSTVAFVHSCSQWQWQVDKLSVLHSLKAELFQRTLSTWDDQQKLSLRKSNQLVTRHVTRQRPERLKSTWPPVVMIAQLLAIIVLDLRVMPFKFSLMGRFRYHVRGGLDVCDMIKAEAPSTSITTSGCGCNHFYV